MCSAISSLSFFGGSAFRLPPALRLIAAACRRAAATVAEFVPPAAWYTVAVATFCLMHGAWHDPYCWRPLAERLRERGHAAVAPELPFHDRTAGFEDRVRPAVDALQRTAEPVVVVAHSMASTYAPLVAARVPVSLVVHLCGRLGFLDAPSSVGGPFRGGVAFPAQTPDGTTRWDAETAIETLYGRLPPDTARELARRLRPLAPAADEYPRCGTPAKAALVYTAEDELFEPAWQRFMASEMLATEPIELPGGHFPMLERPSVVAELLDGLLGT